MKLRLILLVISLLAILSASTGGLLYYTSLKAAAFKEAEDQTISRLAMIQRNLSAYLSENLKTVRALAGMEELLNRLTHPGAVNDLHAANAVLDLFKAALEVEVCYLMNHAGVTVSSSNRNAPDSFVGKNFAFRPYFQQAIHSAPATYLALGTTSGKRGVYHSYPIFVPGEDLPIGLAVIKSSMERVEKALDLATDEIVFVTDPKGIIFISNRAEWLFKSTRALTPSESQAIRASRQFGSGPWPRAGIQLMDNDHAEDAQGNEYLYQNKPLENYPGWMVYYLRNMSAINKSVDDPLIRSTGPTIASLCLLIGASVFFLYREASAEIKRRRAAEAALRKSEERYRNLYHHTPAMLHSINADGRLVSISDHWAEVMGYDREEVTGRPLVEFLSPGSREYFHSVAFPEFLRTGSSKDIAYQFVKRNGEKIDVLLSAIADRDLKNNAERSLAVSIDVTERNRAVAALERAKEELAEYSRELEAKVGQRTQEISSILKYTPDMIYFKDTQGRYRLVNKRFEEIFGIRQTDIRGRTDDQALPPEVAGQFHRHDTQMLKRGRSSMREETIPQADGPHTYLAVRFPIYDESGAIDGVGSISADITAQKKAQNQLRRLSGAIMAGQEKERAAISRELHDELGQVLTALRMEAVWLRDYLSAKDPRAAGRALTMCRLIDKNIADVRGLAKRLRPVVLDDLGIVDALESYTVDYESRTGISCLFEHTDIPAATIDETVATAVYRIAQEALTNVARHARASRVTVSLTYRRRLLALEVADDGCGFHLDALEESEGLGIAGMRERAGLAGGQLTIETAPGQGTRTTLRVPVHGSTGTIP